MSHRLIQRIEDPTDASPHALGIRMSGGKPQKKAEKAVLKIVERAIWNAVMLAKAGVYVFPVRLEDPHPKPNGGVKAHKAYYPFAWSEVATNDVEKVVDLFERWPGSAVGIATGPSGLLGLDLDAGEKDGRASLDQHQLTLPPTHWYPSLGGGEHHIYKAPKKRPAKTLQDLPVEIDGQLVKLSGVDTRATGGMLVYYGPQLEEPPTFAKAPEWAVVDVAPSGAKAEPDIRMADWLDSLHEGKRGVRVREAVESVRSEGMSHGDLLLVTNRLAELGAAGAADVAAAIAEARERYVSHWGGKYAKAWDDAMLDAAQYYGKPLPVLAILDGPVEDKGKKPKKAEAAKVSPKKGAKGKGKKSKGGDLVAPGDPEAHNTTVALPDLPERPHSDPEDFFEPKTGLQSVRLGDLVNWDGTIGAGIDGTAWHYQGGVWVPDDDVIVRRTIELLQDRYRREHAGVARDVVLRGADVPILKGDPHPDFINVRNGMLNWQTGELLPHHPDYLSTVQLPVEYQGGDVETPMFDRWLDEVASEALQPVIWELIAYATYNGNPLQRAAMLMGPGGTGKGTLIRLIEHICGAANTSHLSPVEMTGTFEPARLFGRLLNTNGDLDGKYLPDTGAFKRITGGDGIMAQHKNKPPFEFNPWVFPVFAGNNVAASSDVTTGFYRRWLILPFSRVVDRGKPYDERRLQAEASAIFSRAVSYLPDLLERNEFATAPEVELAKEDFETQSDIVRTWLVDDEHVTLADPSLSGARSARAHLYDVYALWSQRTGHKLPLSRIAFTRRLQSAGYPSSKVKGTWYVTGIQVDTRPLTMSMQSETEGAER